MCDPLHQEYLTINLGSTSHWQQLKLPLVRLFGRWRGRCWPGGTAWGRECRRRSSVLPLNLSDTLLQPVRIAHPYNLSNPSRVGCAIFRMHVAEGCQLGVADFWVMETEPGGGDPYFQLGKYYKFGIQYPLGITNPIRTFLFSCLITILHTLVINNL